MSDAEVLSFLRESINSNSRRRVELTKLRVFQVALVLASLGLLLGWLEMK